ncbi:MAG: hypothetical protein ABLT11_09865, partial [Candidatus Acidiferrum sp.]
MAQTPQEPKSTGSAALPVRPNSTEIDAFLNGRHTDPFALLGPHAVPGGWAIRFFIPWAAEASIAIGGNSNGP